jgi:drug/metabolite transporter (DMT)-like permease
MLLSLRLPLSPEIKGISLCLLAYFCFTCGDAIIKVLGPHYRGLQIFFLNMVASAIMGSVVVLLTSNLKNLYIHQPWLHLTRGLLLLMMQFSATYTFTHVPLGSAYVLVFSAPLITVILAHFWLKENIRPQLWTCVGIGFVGVVICLQPGSAEWHPGLLTALLIGIGHSMLNLLVRQYGQQESPHALMLTSIGTVAVASCWIPFTGIWQPLQWELSGWHLLFGLLGAVAGVSITRAYQLTQASLLGAFQYSQLLWGVLLGYFFWQEIPSASVWVGTVLIVSSGLVILHLRRPAPATNSPLASTLLSQENP